MKPAPKNAALRRGKAKGKTIQINQKNVKDAVSTLVNSQLQQLTENLLGEHSRQDTESLTESDSLLIIHIIEYSNCLSKCHDLMIGRGSLEL